MAQKAVIDIGSLKLKVTVFDTIKKKLLRSDSYLTLMGKGIHETGIIDSESFDKLAVAIKDITNKLNQQKISDVVIIGTDALRKA
jgi:exopolyphosphatase/pppGpp-phosphohydrolase